MEAVKVPQEQVEGRTAKKKPKTFTKKTSFLLLLLTLVISVGTGYALGHFYFWNDVDMKRVNEQLTYYKEEVRKDPANLQNRIVLGYTYYLKVIMMRRLNNLTTCWSRTKTIMMPTITWA